MQLTREQAITEHRKMYNQMADEIEENEFCIDVSLWKNKYLSKDNFCGLTNNCFLCEYSKQILGALVRCCELCPLNPNTIGLCLDGLYDYLISAETWQEQAAFARQIANLPERTDV